MPNYSHNNLLILIIKQHGNLDEIYDFFNQLGTKKDYKLKDVKSWLGY